MGQMIAGVAHELNNPLTAILGVTELLRDRTSDESSRRQLELAHSQARRAAHIVQSLLVFSRPATAHKTLLHLADLLQRTIQLHEHSLRANHVRVDLVARPDLPTVLGDANQLTQVFLNLIVNAEQAIREVREQGTLRIRLGLADERVLITFQDDGVGIPREMLSRIFDPFFTTKRPGRGTGLGLSICMAIVREHNGDISAQPLNGGGSVFTLALPVCTASQAVVDTVPAVSPGHENPKSDSTPTLARKRILAVDDEESILELVAGSLGARGFLVDCAATFDAAMEFAERDSYDAILCDLNLETKAGHPISGFELHDRICETIEERSGKRPVFVFMTGELVDDSAHENASHEGNRILQKPFRMADLQALLIEVLSPAAILQPGNNSD
jgi:CheY-like chemotaxis protein